MMSPALMRPSVTACIASSSQSKTRAGPRWPLRSIPVTLMTQPVGREIAFEDDQAAALLDRVVERPDDFLARRFLRIVRLFGEGAAGDGHRRAVDESALDETLAR